MHTLIGLRPTRLVINLSCSCLLFDNTNCYLKVSSVFPTALSRPTPLAGWLVLASPYYFTLESAVIGGWKQLQLKLPMEVVTTQTSNGSIYSSNFQWKHLQLKIPLEAITAQTSNESIYNSKFQWKQLQLKLSMEAVTAQTFN